MKFWTVADLKTEGDKVTTLSFDNNDTIIPGQFIMAWAPGINMIPLSFSSVLNPKKITVKVYGKASEYISLLKREDKLFFEGPFGNGFKIVNGKKLLIGAGTGIAPLMPLLDNKSYGIISGKSVNDILFKDKFDESRIKVVTDDGSYGLKGFATEALKLFDLNEFDMIYACGPEIMLKSVFDFIKGKNIKAQFSLERPMKCGIGLCDSCSINGYQVCRDGPVFTEEQLLEMDEFGRTRLKYSGRRIYF